MFPGINMYYFFHRKKNNQRNFSIYWEAGIQRIILISDPAEAEGRINHSDHRYLENKTEFLSSLEVNSLDTSPRRSLVILRNFFFQVKILIKKKIAIIWALKIRYFPFTDILSNSAEMWWEKHLKLSSVWMLILQSV